jgi:hypothetical protein
MSPSFAGLPLPLRGIVSMPRVVKFKPFNQTLSFNLYPLTFFFIFAPLSTVDKFVLIATTEKNAKMVSPAASQQSVPAIVKLLKLTYELFIYF